MFTVNPKNKLSVNGKDYLLNSACGEAISIFEINESAGLFVSITRIPVEENYEEVAVAAIIAHQAIQRAAAARPLPVAA